MQVSCAYKLTEKRFSPARSEALSHYRVSVRHTGRGRIGAKVVGTARLPVKSQAAAAMPNNVAVIGAGPAGLTSARFMLEAGMTPTIFDKAPTIGGLWGPAGAAWDTLVTNLSRNTCSFSEMPLPPGSDIYLRREQAYEYLSGYAETFLKPIMGTEHVKLNAEVMQVDRAVDSTRWNVQWKSADGELLQQDFDQVVVASGFFSKPDTSSIPGMETFPGRTLHATQYRRPGPFAGLRVAVIGGLISGLDISAELAPIAKSVVHVVPRGIWLLPPYVPAQPDSPETAFIPLDWSFFKRKPKPAEGAKPPSKQDVMKATHTFFKSICGNQGEVLHPAWEVDEDLPPYIGTVREAYFNFVKAGKIEAIKGRLESVAGDELTLDNGTSRSGFDAIILCTGYHVAVPFLSPDVLEAINFDSTDKLMPTLMYRSVLHPQLPGMAFVGMYRNPHWAVIETQARWVAALMSGRLEPPTEEQLVSGIAQEAAIRAAVPRPQFTGFMPDLADAFASDLGILPPDDLRQPGVMVLPQHYSGNPEAARAASATVAGERIAFDQGKMVSHQAFRALQGEWKLQRTIINRAQPNEGPISVNGTAKFIMSTTTPDEYLYHEECGATKQLIWQYSKSQDRIVVYLSDEVPASKMEWSPTRKLVDLSETGNNRTLFQTVDIQPPAEFPTENSSSVLKKGAENGHGGDMAVLEAGKAGDVMGGTDGLKGGWRAFGSYASPEYGTHKSAYRFKFAGLNLIEVEIKCETSGKVGELSLNTLLTNTLVVG